MWLLFNSGHSMMIDGGIYYAYISKYIACGCYSIFDQVEEQMS